MPGVWLQPADSSCMTGRVSEWGTRPGNRRMQQILCWSPSFGPTSCWHLFWHVFSKGLPQGESGIFFLNILQMRKRSKWKWVCKINLVTEFIDYLNLFNTWIHWLYKFNCLYEFNCHWIELLMWIQLLLMFGVGYMARKRIRISHESWMVSWYKNEIVQAGVSNCMHQRLNFLVLNIHIPAYLGSRGKLQGCRKLQYGLRLCHASNQGNYQCWCVSFQFI